MRTKSESASRRQSSGAHPDRAAKCRKKEVKITYKTLETTSGINICIIGVLEDEDNKERKKGPEKLFEEIAAKTSLI